MQIAFDGNSIQQTVAIDAKAKHVINVFLKANLPANDLVLGFHTIAIPTLYYPLPATTIPAKHLMKTQKKIANALLPKLGLNRTFPRAVVYAPKYFGGLGFSNLPMEQSIAHITSIIGHFRANTTLSDNYVQLIESYMMLAGLTTSPFVNTVAIDYVKAPWVELTRTFLRDNNAVIILPRIPTLPPLREHDIDLMEYARQQSYDTNHLNEINKCRCTSKSTSSLKLVTQRDATFFRIIPTPAHLPRSSNRHIVNHY